MIVSDEHISRDRIELALLLRVQIFYLIDTRVIQNYCKKKARKRNFISGARQVKDKDELINTSMNMYVQRAERIAILL